MPRQRTVTVGIFLGIAISHVFFTFFVYQSNQALYDKLQGIRNAGYVAVPNSLISEELCRIVPAVCGAVFFTATVGATLSFLSIGAAWIWCRWGRRRIYLMIPFICLWIAAPLKFFTDGIHPLLVLWMFLLPLILYAFVLKWGGVIQKSPTGIPWRIISAFIMLLVCYGAIAQSKSALFLDIRDVFLFNFSIGNHVNDFYYKYTLYPAEAFKALHQKQLKTCHIKKNKNGRVESRLASVLCAHNYLPIPGEASPELTVTLVEKKIVFHKQGREVYQTGLKAFLSQPSIVLKKVSINSDAYSLFRRFTAISLLTGMPALLLFMLYFSACVFASFFFKPPRASVVAAWGCLALMGVFVIMLGMYRHAISQEKGLSDDLVSHRRQLRGKALKTLAERRFDIAEYRFVPPAPGTGSPAERYWFVKALGLSDNPESLELILPFLEDPHLNVRCVALEALGRRGNRAMWPVLLNRLNSSHSWYVQLYAYKALRNLGWKQSLSH